jgi:hypothetical protein
MKRTLAVAILAAAHVAAAEPHHVLVLRAEGNADAATKTKVETQVLKIAKNLDGQVEAGDISFADAAAATGCAPTEPACKDDVLSTMGVDEIVVSTVNTVPGGVEVKVKRLAKGQPPRESATLIPTAQPPDAKMNADVGPMFGMKAPPPTELKKTLVVPPPPAVTTNPTPVPETAGPKPEPGPAGTVTASPNGQLVPPPPEGETPSGGNRRLEVSGLVAGGVLVGVGVIFWASAQNQQDAIDMSTPRSPKDFQNLQDLESTGDTYATLGNICFIGGVALAAVSGYFLWRDRHHSDSARHARIVPTVYPGGGGIAITFGGSR